MDRSKRPQIQFVFQRRGQRCPCPLDPAGRAAEKQPIPWSSVAINRSPLAGFAGKRHVKKLRSAPFITFLKTLVDRVNSTQVTFRGSVFETFARWSAPTGTLQKIVLEKYTRLMAVFPSVTGLCAKAESGKARGCNSVGRMAGAKYGGGSLFRSRTGAQPGQSADFIKNPPRPPQL